MARSTQSSRNSIRKGKRKARDEESEDEEDDSQEKEDDEDNEEENEEENPQERQKSPRSAGISKEETDRLANNLVRLAIFNEFKKTALPRSEINKKVLGPHIRSFAQVYERAQKTLNKTFGMSLVGLEKRVGEGPDESEMKEGKKPKKKSFTHFILISTLPQQLIAHAVTPTDDVLDHDDDDGDERNELDKESGAIIDYKRGDELALYGILQFVLSVILCSGRTLSDKALFSYLKRLNILPGTRLPVSTKNALDPLTFEDFLKLSVKQGYLTKHKSIAADFIATQRENDETDQGFEYRWGGRADKEIGEKAIAELIGDTYFYKEQGELDDEEDEAERRQTGEILDQRRERLLKDIGRAAGGELVGAEIQL